MQECNNLKRIAETLGPERDAIKNHLIEITNKQFEVNLLQNIFYNKLE